MASKECSALESGLGLQAVMLAVNMLCNSGAAVNAPDLSGTTPLMLACSLGCPLELVDVLILLGGDALQADKDGSTPLIAAVIASTTYSSERLALSVCRQLLIHQAGQQLRWTDHLGFTAMHWAVALALPEVWAH
jgi:ankyrin repeat protein